MYSSVMVVLVAIALTIVAVLLKPKQEYNKKVEKMQNILISVHIESTPKNAEEIYKKYITEALVVNSMGEVKEGITAFDVEMQLENKKKSEERNLPVFICMNEKSQKFYIVPVRGKGLWGPIWGYVSFREDLNTIEGTQFGHKGETPGLGAEINTPKFQDQFVNKTILNNDGSFVSVMVVKGDAVDSDMHGVDAISGGTITSKGLEAMLHDCLKEYTSYFAKIRK
jgi:Na+-transporting NADH:ubiquinone oxidoreductase subunit C